MLIDGGSGATTVRAGSANVTLNGGSGALDYLGGDGSSIINFGSGAATVQSGNGNSLFTFDAAKAAPSVMLNDFTLGKDFISFHDFSAHPIVGSAWVGKTEHLALGGGTNIAINFATH